MSNEISKSAEETRELGASLARAAMRASSDQAIVIALNGELGAGKTTFVAGFLRALGTLGPIRSPTYTLIEPYELETRTVYHLDLYRLVNSRDLEMLALRDLLNAGSVLLVEWANRGGSALPTPDLTIELAYSAPSREEGHRLIEMKASSTVGKELADSLHS